PVFPAPGGLRSPCEQNRGSTRRTFLPPSARTRGGRSRRDEARAAVGGAIELALLDLDACARAVIAHAQRREAERRQRLLGRLDARECRARDGGAERE